MRQLLRQMLERKVVGHLWSLRSTTWSRVGVPGSSSVPLAAHEPGGRRRASATDNSNGQSSGPIGRAAIFGLELTLTRSPTGWRLTVPSGGAAMAKGD